MFHRGFPSYKGLIWFSYGLGVAIVQKLRGNIMSSPALNILRTLRWMPIKFSGKIRVSNCLCQLRAFQILYSFICSYVSVMWIKFISLWQSCHYLETTYLIFNFALPILRAPCASILGALCVSILVPLSASILVPLRVSTFFLYHYAVLSVPQEIPKLHGSYLVFFWRGWCGNFLEIEGQHHVKPSPRYLFNLPWVPDKVAWGN